VLRGFYCLGGTLNVTQAHLFDTPSHACPGRSHESENCRSGAERWRRYDGERFGANAAATHDGERFGTNTAATHDGERFGTNTAATYDGERFGTNAATAATECPISSSRI
jgi:hypothetical protein